MWKSDVGGGSNKCGFVIIERRRVPDLGMVYIRSFGVCRTTSIEVVVYRSIDKAMYPR